MSMLGLGAMLAVVVVVGSVGLPLVAEQIAGGEHDEGAELSEATGAAMRQANDVGDSFGRLVPSSAEAGSEGNGDDSGHEVAAALGALASADAGETGAVADERIVAIEALRDAWGPRYRRATEERRRLAYRIEHAQRAARRYFETQTELTGRIRDPEERSRAEAGDVAEMRLYARWRDQAHRTRAQTDSIMNDLHDMDIRITKRMLSADFASVYHDFLELPIAMGDLERDLERFRVRSEEMGAAFGGIDPPPRAITPNHTKPNQTKPHHTKQGENRCW